MPTEPRPEWWPAGTPCLVCGEPAPRRQPTCSRVCGGLLAHRTMAGEVEAERRRKIAVRMRAVRAESPNPMDDPEVRARMSATLRRIGHRPKVRGGNGTGPTVAELALFEELTRRCGPMLWNINYVESNGPGSRARGLPAHYKIDLAAPSWRVAVEVDGPSHSATSRQEQDRRKDAVLRARGWTVVRVTNRQVLEAPADAAARIIEAGSAVAGPQTPLGRP